MKPIFFVASALCAAALFVGCEKKGSTEAGADKPTPAGKPDPRAKPGAAAAVPEGPPKIHGGPAGPYAPFPRQIPASCAEPAVLLTTVPPTAAADYAYPWTAQTMVAHDEYEQVGSEGELSGNAKAVMYFEGKFKGGDSRALAARCGSVATCNKLAAMYKAVVRTSTPDVGCGLKAVGVDAPRPKSLADHAMPGDTIGKCARINACLIAYDHDYPGNPGIECQKAPSGFKLACATESPCEKVLRCMGRM